MQRLPWSLHPLSPAVSSKDPLRLDALQRLSGFCCIHPSTKSDGWKADVMMSSLSGFNSDAAIKKSPTNIKFILLSLESCEVFCAKSCEVWNWGGDLSSMGESMLLATGSGGRKVFYRYSSIVDIWHETFFETQGPAGEKKCCSQLCLVRITSSSYY